MARDNERSHREGHIGQNQVGVLTTPGPDITRRAGRRRPHGSQRSAVEIFNRQHAEWSGKEFDDEYSALKDTQVRAIRRKIRKALYASDGDFQIRKGTMTYKDAVKKHGFKLSALRRKLDSTFGLLAMAEASWASDMFIQEVFKVDRTYKPAGSNWIHPKNRIPTASATASLRNVSQPPRTSRARNVRANQSRNTSRRNVDAGPVSQPSEVRVSPARVGTHPGTDASEYSHSEKQKSLSDGERNGERNSNRVSARKKNLSDASPEPAASRKKRRLRRVFESDEDECDEEVQHGYGQDEEDEEEEEDQLLRKLKEIRRKRARRAEN